jgi:hypothetical protein
LVDEQLRFFWQEDVQPFDRLDKRRSPRTSLSALLTPPQLSTLQSKAFEFLLHDPLGFLLGGFLALPAIMIGRWVALPGRWLPPKPLAHEEPLTSNRAGRTAN